MATYFVSRRRSRVARQLIEAHHDVIAIARNPASAAALTTLGAHVVHGDVTDKDSLRAPMTGVDGVFHLAGWYRIGARDARAATRVNVDGTRNVLELVRDLQVPRCIYPVPSPSIVIRTESWLTRPTGTTARG